MRSARSRESEEDAWKLLDRASTAGYSNAFVVKLRALANADNVSALAVLAMLHGEGLSDARGKVLVKRDRRSAIRYDDRGAELGDPASMTAVADRLAQDRAGGPALQRAKRLYRRACARGYSTAAYNLACTFQNRGEYREAVRWFRRALEMGDSSALLQLAHAELYGIGTRRNAAAAFDKLRRLVRSRDTYVPSHWMQCEAMIVMADALIAGWLVRRNYDEGVRWLRRAAKLGSQAAKARL